MKKNILLIVSGYLMAHVFMWVAAWLCSLEPSWIQLPAGVTGWIGFAGGGALVLIGICRIFEASDK